MHDLFKGDLVKVLDNAGHWKRARIIGVKSTPSGFVYSLLFTDTLTTGQHIRSGLIKA